MATRFYLTTATAPYSPATFRGAWDDTAGAVTRWIATHKASGGNIATVSRAENVATDEWDVLLYRGVSGPLAAQTISGTVDALLGAWQGSGAGNFCYHLHVYVTQGDSDTPRGTLLTDYRELVADEWGINATTNGERLTAAQAIASLAVSTGDRLVVEIGYAARNTITSSVTGNLRYGTAVGGIPVGDLAAGGNSSQAAGWIEFSGTIAEQVVTARSSQLAVEVLSTVATVSTLAANVSQVVVEAISANPPLAARVTQLVVETLSKSPLYDCPTASAGPSICGAEPVLTWIEQTQTLVGSPASSTRVVSDAPLNDPTSYYSGKKEPRVLDFGEISRQLSDVQGQWTAATMRWREAEIDRAVRRRFGDPAAYAVTNAIDVCRMIRESDWRDQLEARLMFIGHRLQAAPAEDRSIEQESGDQLARDLELAGQEIECPRRTFSHNYTPGIPKELQDIPEPIIYGRYSDALSSATPPSMWASAVYGGYMTDGIYADFGWASMPCDCLAPTGVSVSEGGGGSIDVADHPAGKLYAIVTSVDATGRESDPSTFAQRNTALVPSVSLSGSGKTVTVTWSAPAGTTPTYYRIYIGHEYTGIVHYYQWMQIAGTDPLTVTFDNAPSFDEVALEDYSQVASGASRVSYSVYAYYAAAAQMADGSWTALASPMGIGMANPYRRTARIEWYNVPPGAVNIGIWKFPEFTTNRPPLGYFIVPYTGSPLPTYVDDDWLGTNELTTDEWPHERGAIDLAPYYGGQELVALDGQYWHRWFVAAHACKDVILYFDGARVDPGSAGVDWLWPGATGYEERFGNPYYRDFNGRRYCVVYARGPAGDRAASSSGYEIPEDTSSPSSPPGGTLEAATLYANVEGIEDAADGSGALIDDLFEQEIHWWINWGPLGDYQAGRWLPMPDWTPIADHCKLSTESWRDARDAAVEAFGAPILGASYLRERATMRDWIARWRLSTDTRVGVNAAGQWMVAWHPTPATAVSSATFTEQRHIQGGSVRFEPLHDEHWTVIPYSFAEDAIDGDWQTGEVEDPAETAAYGERRVAGGHELFFVRSAAFAAFVAGRVLARHATVPWRVTVETIDLCGTLVDLGQVISLTGLWGLDDAGWVQFPIVLEAVVVLPAEQRTRLTGRTLAPPHETGSP